MYYVMNNDELAIFNDSKEIIETTLKFMPQLKGQYILETDIITADELQAHPNKVIIDDIEIEIDVPDYDEDGNPIMIVIEETVEVIDYDEEGNPIGSHTETITKLVPSTHKETITVKGLVLNPDYEQEEEQKHREYLNNLSLTKREVFLALYKDKGITPEQLKAGITDPEALIEFEYANDYFRGNPLITIIGQSLGYSSDDLDYLFEHKELPHEDTVIEVPDMSEDNG